MSRVKSVGIAVLFVMVALVPLAGTSAAEGFAPGWSDAERIAEWNPSGGNPQGMQATIADDGRVLYSWYQYDNGASLNFVKTRVYDPVSGFGPESYVGYGTGSYNQYSPKAAAFPNGSFILVYEVDRGSTSDLVCKVWINGKGWMPDLRLSPYPYPNDVHSHQVATDGQGNAFVMWVQYDGTESNLTARRYMADGNLESTSYLLESLPETTRYAKLAVDDTGNAMVVWNQHDGSVQRAYANRYVVGSGFGSATLIDRGPYDVDQVWVALDQDGNGVAVIDQHDGTRDRHYANTFTVGTGWGTPEIIDTDNGWSPNGLIMLERTGPDEMIAMWQQYNGSGYNIHTATYAAGTGWTQAQNLSEDWGLVAPGSFYADASLDGTVKLVWYDYTPAYDNYITYVRSYTPDHGWSGPSAVADGYFPYATGLSCNAVGQCALLFEEYDGNVWAKYAVLYSHPDADPPALSLSGPRDGAMTETPSVMVSGTTEPGSTVVVNGVQAVVSDAGAFSLSVALMPGDNTIDVVATDAAGNSATSSVTVNYHDPVPDLQGDLATTQGDLAATQADLDATQTDLDAANADIAGLHTEINDADAAIQATNAELDQTKADLANAEADLAAAQTDVTATEDKLTTQEAADATHTTEISTAADSAGMAMMVGILGILLGAVALAMGFMMGRKGSGGTGGGGEVSSVPPPEPASPPPAPAVEPPKAM